MPSRILEAHPRGSPQTPSLLHHVGHYQWVCPQTEPKSSALGALVADSGAFSGRAAHINDLASLTKCIVFLTLGALAIHCISFYAL